MPQDVAQLLVRGAVANKTDALRLESRPSVDLEDQIDAFVAAAMIEGFTRAASRLRKVV